MFDVVGVGGDDASEFSGAVEDGGVGRSAAEDLSGPV